ncbi:MAG: DUF5320 domain-containing protein [Methanoregulaceae archaeon]|nr:DUF5320 domain-containing protein [Methanoregulaceae archaeon]MCU0629399.1 DUF5320 domain-containing protein [Methanoregulaceae archaeon]
MPGFDGTGPLGRGPRTGWARGYCVAVGAPVPQQGAIPQTAGTETQGQIPLQPAPGAGPVLFGRGRGGIPWGCGRGFGGGMRGGRCGPRGGGMRGRF